VTTTGRGRAAADGRSRPPVSALELFGLCGFAVAAPVFDLLGSNPEFFVAHGGGAGPVVFIALGLSALPPLACITLHWLASLAGPRAARISGLAWLGALVGLIAWVPLNRSESLEEPVGAGLAIGVAVLAIGLYSRLPSTRQLLRLGALAPPTFALLFLLQPGLRPLLWPAQIDAATLEASDGAPPIVMLVLDELPLSSVQDASGAVNAVRFPALAGLAREGLLFTGVSTVATHTDQAIPAILTGRYPGTRPRVPAQAEFPENLFSLLAERYQLNVMESVTLLHPESPLTQLARDSGGNALVSDVALVYMHQILPRSLRDRLPPIATNWGSFWEREGGGPTFWQQARINIEAGDRRPLHGEGGHLKRFRRYIEAVERFESDGRPPLHFLHIIYPHQPWRTLPSGDIYMPQRNVGQLGPRWPAEPWWSVDAYRRHLLQAMHADRLVGELVELLRAEGLYERAVVIVVADHGSGFWPKSAFRVSKGLLHPGDVLSVPLIIKAPGVPGGRRIDRAGELVDLLPTLGQLAGFEIPWETDGCSLLDPACVMRPTRRLYQKLRVGVNRRVEYPLDITDSRATLEHKLELFGSDELGLYRAGRCDGIVGRSIEELAVTAEPVGSLHIDKSIRAIYRGEEPDLRPARLVGHLGLHQHAKETPEVALAVDGVVQVCVPAPHATTATRRVAAMLPEAVLDHLPQGLSAYHVVERPNALPLLHPLEIR